MKPHRPGALLVLLLATVFTSGALRAQPVPEHPQDGSMNIDTPANGMRVFGTATVNIQLYELWMDAVQFQLDGQPLGAPVLAPPIRITWDTTTVSDGWHTLSAVGVDQYGYQYTTPPVTIRVGNQPPAPAALAHYEETDVSYGPGWQPHYYYDWVAWSGGTGSAMETSTAGATATFNFNGTSITWIGYRGMLGGIARVSIDGHFVAEIDLFGRRDETMSRVYTVGGLTPGNHTIAIEATGDRNIDSHGSVVLIDAFETPRQVVAHLQESDPDIAWSGDWETLDATQRPWNGGFATLSQTAGAHSTLTFNGIGIRWIGYHGPQSGIARVYLDGAFVREVDGYALHPQHQDLLFEATGLAPGTHTIRIEATGLKNPAASDAFVAVDAFDVTRSGERFQENDWAVSYTGPWALNNNKPWSEGIAYAAYYPDLTATLKFVGTGVSWIGFRAARTGIAQVYVDGVRYPDVDTYVPSGEGWQDTVFSVAGLAHGPHTLRIEVHGDKNPAATNAYIVVDAFDVQR